MVPIGLGNRLGAFVQSPGWWITPHAEHFLCSSTCAFSGAGNATCPFEPFDAPEVFASHQRRGEKRLHWQGSVGFLDERLGARGPRVGVFQRGTLWESLE